MGRGPRGQPGPLRPARGPRSHLRSCRTRAQSACSKNQVQNCSEADASIVLTNTCAVCLKDWLERLERLERQVLCLDQGQRVLQGQVNSVMGFALGAGAGLGASLAAVAIHNEGTLHSWF